jgi:hypothetical protein
MSPIVDFSSAVMVFVSCRYGEIGILVLQRVFSSRLQRIQRVFSPVAGCADAFDVWDSCEVPDYTFA